MRAVIDTGVLVSGLIRPQGTTGNVLKALRDGLFTIVYSNETMLEIVEVLGRDKFRKKYHIMPDDISALVNLIRLRGEAVLVSLSVAECRDPKDDKFLEAALEGKVDCLVSGDHDLLSMNPFRSIPILSPAEFLTRIKNWTGDGIIQR
ncbi:MAG: putative toxin-antitoxin system toxin component, PIN family [Anaerolineales bacterium]|nr:putative toxin-antitoxin system toxin component, PIN family [Anaerolineales bacterium]